MQAKRKRVTSLCAWRASFEAAASWERLPVCGAPHGEGAGALAIMWGRALGLPPVGVAGLLAAVGRLWSLCPGGVLPVLDHMHTPVVAARALKRVEVGCRVRMAFGSGSIAQRAAWHG